MVRTWEAIQVSAIAILCRQKFYSISIRDLGSYRQALYCFGKAARLDPENFNALWDRASLAKDMHELQVARNSYLALLKGFPHNIVVLTELRHILIEQRELTLCAKLYQEAFDHYSTIFPSGKPESSAVIDPALTVADEQPIISNSSADAFTLMEILVLADLYNSLDLYEKTIRTIRSGCRWLQGRFREKFWDLCPDDREYDLGGYDRAGNEQGDSVGMRPGYHALDINARHRLAVARLKIGDINEGRVRRSFQPPISGMVLDFTSFVQMHAGIILSQNAADFSALFSEIADAYFDREMYADAGLIYEILGGDTEVSILVHVLKFAPD